MRFPQSEGRDLYLRFIDASGHLTPVDFFLQGEKVDAQLLRRIPLGRYEAVANRPTTAKKIREGLQLAAPDLRTAIRFFASDYGSGEPAQPKPDWAYLMMRAQVDEALPRPPARLAQGRPIRAEERAPKLRIEMPTSKPFPDQFWRSVAAVYSQALGTVRGPVTAIADANGVPVERVYSWLKETRKRGYLPPGTPGRAG